MVIQKKRSGTEGARFNTFGSGPFYASMEEIDLTGMEVRGRNLTEGGVTVLAEGDYDVEYDFPEPGKAVITVLCTMEDEAGTENTLTDSFEVVIFGDGEEEVQAFVTGIAITEKPYRMVYERDDAFDEEGMVVEKTVKVVTASSSNASYKETVPFEELEIEPEEFSKTGKSKVLVTYYAEGEDGKEKAFTAVLNVTVARPGAAAEGDLSAALQRLEEALSLGEYVTAEEKQEAFRRAHSDAEEALEALGGGRLSDKAAAMLEELEKAVLKAYPQIFTAVKADGRLKNVTARGLGLNADLEAAKDLESGKIQELILRLERPEEEIPDEIRDEVKGYVAMEITLLLNGEEIQPKLPLRVTMDIPAGLEKENLVLYHYHEGEIKLIRPVIRGNRMSFDIHELSLFVAANTKDTPKPVKPDDEDSEDTDIQGPGFTIPGEWKKDEAGWWYQKKDGGYISASWARINGLWYHFDKQGYMQTGWILDQGIWYYLNDDGSMAAQKWILWKGQWYYVNWNGAMAVNTMTPDGYVVGNDGAWKKPER